MLIVAIILALMFIQSHAQNGDISSTYGQEFFIGFMSNLRGATTTNLRVTVGTPGESTQFTVETCGNWSYNNVVTYGSPVVVDLPSELQITGSDYSNRHKAVHIFSLSRQKIFVLGENFILFNHATFQAYPHQPIEGIFSYEYLIVSAYERSNNFRSEFLLVGCENDTVITIVPSLTASLTEDPQLSNSTTINVEAGTSSHQFILHRMQTLLVSHVDDLTGTNIVSNKPLTVISGHECANQLGILHNYYYSDLYSGCEPLAYQVPPTATWGTRFLIFHHNYERLEIKGIMLNNDNILITCNRHNLSDIHGPYYLGIPSGFAFNLFTYDKYCYLESTVPTFVTQSYGERYTQGDPAYTMAAPVDQYVHEIDFVSLPSNTFPSNYISVTVSAEHFDADSILLDGTSIDCQWREIYNVTYNDMDVVGYGCNKAILSGATTPTQHRVNHTDPDGLLSVIAYGFSTSPPRGYAYLTGQVLKIDETDIISIPLINLTNFTDVQELQAETDTNSQPIDIPDGFMFGDTFVTSAYVNENGVISFENSWNSPYPETFPTSNYYFRNGLAVAPFWSDNDIRRAGAVRYITYSSFDSDNLEGRRLMNEINAYIRTQQRRGEERFEDINECEGINDCQQICENTEGSYTCRCTKGFSLINSSGSCMADLPCASDSICSHGCAMVHGREECFCPLGFELTQNQTQCIDQNECLHLPCDQVCTNNEGSFECTCLSGYEQQSDRHCEDIGECLERAIVGHDLCASNRNTQCINTIGSFECLCVSGYVRVNGTCQYTQEKPPPPSPVAIPMIGKENSINFTSSALELLMFTPDKQQSFREVTAEILSSYCNSSVLTCNLVLMDGTVRYVMDLRINPMNIAIPVSLIGEDERGQLKFTLYVQLSDGFLSKEQLELAIQQADEQYRDAGFYQPLPATTTDSPMTNGGITTPNSSKSIPTLLPGVPSNYFIITLMVIAAFVLLVVLYSVTAIISYTCYFRHNRQKQQSAGESGPVQLGHLYKNPSSQTKPQIPQCSNKTWI